MVWLALFFIAYILLDFTINKPTPLNYQFKVTGLSWNKPIILKQKNMMIILARYNQSFLESIEAEGRIGGQLSSSKERSNLVDEDGYFVVAGTGTHIGCPLVIEQTAFKESCSDATYSLTGQSKNLALYNDLKKLEYQFTRENTILTIY